MWFSWGVLLNSGIGEGNANANTTQTQTVRFTEYYFLIPVNTDMYLFRVLVLAIKTSVIGYMTLNHRFTVNTLNTQHLFPRLYVDYLKNP